MNGILKNTLIPVALALSFFSSLVVQAQDNKVGSLKFTKNEVGQQEYAQIDKLPATFSQGEFTFEIWIKPDNTYPVGITLATRSLPNQAPRG